MKFNSEFKTPQLNPWNNIPRIVKSRYLRNFTLCFMLFLSGLLYAQNITVNFDEASLEKALKELAKQADYEVLYTQKLLKDSKPVTLNFKNANLKEALDAVFKNQNLKYTLTNKTIVVTSTKSDNLSAQLINVTGIVLNTNKEPFPGVTVHVLGTNKFSISDFDGRFSIENVPSNGIIECSGLTIGKKSFSVNGQTQLTLVVEEKITEMDEVVVTGYKTITRSHLTGAVSKIDQKTLNQNINTDLLAALEGRVAGLMYQKNPYGASSDTPILRGIGTFSSLQVGYSPLIVIDGLPTELTLDQINPYDIESVNVLKDAAAASIYGSRAANGIIVLTTKKGKGNLKVSVNTDFFISTKPNLKDLNYASTSDLIDFEQAVYERERNRYSDISSMFDGYGTIGSSNIEYYSPLYQLNRDLETGTLSQSDYDNTIAQWRNNDYLNDYRKNVWQNEFRQRYNVSFSGSSNKQNTYVSFNYDQSDNRLKYNKDQSFNLYAKSSYQLNNWLDATVGINGTIRNADITDSSYDDFNIQKRYERITDDNGNLVISPFVGISDGFTSSGVINPLVASQIAGLSGFNPVTFNILESLQEGVTHRNSLNLRAFAKLRAKLWKGLSVSSQFQYETARTNSDQFYGADSYKMRYAINTLTGYNPDTNTYTYLDGFSEGGRYKQLSSQASNYSFRNQLDYSQEFGEGKHFVSAIAGFEMRETSVPRSIESLRYGYDPVTLSSATINTLDLSQTGVDSYIYGRNKTLSAPSRNQEEILHRYFSVYSTLNYTYLNKYNVTGSYRVDRADLFGVDSKYKNRPLWSAGLGWNITNENFMKSVSWVNALKLRATHGVSGNVDQTTTPYVTANWRNDRLYQSLQYINITAQPNPMLRWEKTTSSNLGLDFSVLQSKLRGSIDVYRKYSSDLLATTDLDPTVGALTRRINAGALLNKGVEFSIGSDWYKKGGFSMGSNLVLAFNKTTVDKVTREQSNASVYVSSPTNYFLEGETYNSLYAYKYGGMINGYPYVLDENGEPSITFDEEGNPLSNTIKTITNPDALVNKGSLMPTYTGSFSQHFSFKQFELNMLLVFSGGNVMRKDVIDMSSDDVNDQDIVNRYTDLQQNGNTRLYVDFDESVRNYAGTISSQWRNSDVNVIDGDYIKLRNISLGYNLPEAFAKKIKFSSAKFTFQVNNLWYWSAAGNRIDPEVYASNSGTRSIPLPKTFLLGLNLNI
ncbi:SusC/RagA family TonB-linked outer membrane protein [Aestuariibaculum sp. M13]|uniref:SusC/RagA family TonB-linked outer membrane protein n=1 Tax=Aestuariibaculum sp. M13 TaxID=2967132 RepID=UPI002159C62C|nr:SusC/RagA family TonB-linked outer membrane protein [Aestuariibaculum sp. M13]MCR8668946.1 SusC/RagA family TonB-linked outer membrane protein [Aestuariibaculum sp. M13]